MPAKTYSDRLRPLLSLGDPRTTGEDWRDPVSRWRDYAGLGLSPGDEAELIAMATDKQLNRSSPPGCFAPVHAWRALGQFRCQGAVRPLVDILDHLAKINDDWGLEEVPDVLALIGPAALPELKRTLPDQRRGLWARAAIGRAMTQIGLAEPSHRATVVQALTDQVALSRHNDPDLNGLLIGDLMELKAVESAGVIRRAYDAGDVDEQVSGSLTDVLAGLGMAQEESPFLEPDKIDRRIVDDVMQAYNAKQRVLGGRENPLSRAEHEQSMRELTGMIKERLGGEPGMGSAPDDPIARAQDLAYRAMDSGSIKESLALAAQALALDPDCVDALVLRAERTIKDPDLLIAAYERAVAAGERSLGKKFFKDNAGEFWAMLETRPYMRARARLAELLRRRHGRSTEAIAHYEAMLDLNAGDNLGLRYALIGCYLEQGRADAMAELLKRFDEDSAFFLWPKVFMHVLTEDGRAAERALARARKENAHVEPLLTEIKPMPKVRPDAYAWGGPDEAVFVAENIVPALRRQPALAAWLKTQKR